MMCNDFKQNNMLGFNIMDKYKRVRVSSHQLLRGGGAEMKLS